MEAKINVIQYLPQLSDNGAETLVKDYVSLLDKRVFEPIVVVNKMANDSINQKVILERGIRIVPVYKHWNMMTRIWHHFTWKWYVPFRLLCIIRKEKAKVMHIHTGVLKYVKPLSKYLKNVKLVYTCHSLPSRYFGNGQEQEFNAAKVLITRNKLQLIAISKGMAKELDLLFGISNTVFIPNGIEIERFENVKESKDNLRNKNGIPVSAFVLGQVGRFEDSKNHLFTIDVFHEIAKKRNDAFLLIVGAGKNEGLIREKLHQYGLDKQYIILSHRKDIPELLKTMDAFIFPSKYEGLGIAVIESQIAGIRSVVSDAVPKDAFITPIAIPMSLNCSPKEWANVILDDSILNSEYGNKEDYNMRNVINKLEEVYLSDGFGTTINH